MLWLDQITLKPPCYKVGRHNEAELNVFWWLKSETSLSIRKDIWAASREKVPNVLNRHTKRKEKRKKILKSQCHTKRRMGEARRVPILLLVWHRIRPLGTISRDAAHKYFNTLFLSWLVGGGCLITCLTVCISVSIGNTLIARNKSTRICCSSHV